LISGSFSCLFASRSEELFFLLKLDLFAVLEVVYAFSSRLRESAMMVVILEVLVVVLKSAFPLLKLFFTPSACLF